jgi:hypothetical protein
MVRIALLFAAASGLLAQATYSYIGNTFSSFARGTVPASDHITVTLTLPSALPVNVIGTEFYPSTWAISDGVNTISSSNPASYTVPAGFEFYTGATGGIVGWSVVGYGSGGVSMSTSYVAFQSAEDTSQHNNINGQQIGAGGVLGNPGVWTSSITPQQVLPSLIVSPSSLVISTQVGASPFLSLQNGGLIKCLQ